MNDNRPDWQIAIAIRLQTAAGYLRLLELDEQHKQVYQNIYKTGDLDEWVKEKVDKIIIQVNYTAAKRDCVVPSVEAHWNDVLHERGLNGTVTLVGGIKTDDNLL